VQQQSTPSKTQFMVMAVSSFIMPFPVILSGTRICSRHKRTTALFCRTSQLQQACSLQLRPWSGLAVPTTSRMMPGECLLGAGAYALTAATMGADISNSLALCAGSSTHGAVLAPLVEGAACTTYPVRIGGGRGHGVRLWCVVVLVVVCGCVCSM
jgi:hypothetical protein